MTHKENQLNVDHTRGWVSRRKAKRSYVPLLFDLNIPLPFYPFKHNTYYIFFPYDSILWHVLTQRNITLFHTRQDLSKLTFQQKTLPWNHSQIKDYSSFLDMEDILHFTRSLIYFAHIEEYIWRLRGKS